MTVEGISKQDSVLVLGKEIQKRIVVQEHEISSFLEGLVHNFDTIPETQSEDDISASTRVRLCFEESWKNNRFTKMTEYEEEAYQMKYISTLGTYRAYASWNGNQRTLILTLVGEDFYTCKIKSSVAINKRSLVGEIVKILGA